MTLSLASIATDDDLANELGGAARLNSTQASSAVRDAYRASALLDVVAALGTRSPPVLDSDLSFPAELKMAVVYRALSKICYGAATGSSEDRNLVLAKKYETDYLGAIRGRFTVTPGVTSPSGNTFSWERR